MDGLHFFDLPGQVNILDEEHFGIVNGKLAAGIPYRHVAGVSGLWAPPFVSSNFLLEARLGGERVRTRDYLWRPYQVERRGRLHGWDVSSVVTLLFGRRAGVLELTLHRPAGGGTPPPFELLVSGWLDRADSWGFARPESKTETVPVAEKGRLVLPQGEQAVVLGLAGAEWQASGNLGFAAVPDASVLDGKSLYVVFAMGPRAEAAQAVEEILADPASAVTQARNEYLRRVEDLLAKLPLLESSNRDLVRFYRRSLVHLLMNRWEVPEFLLHPYYGTGSVKGGCVCNYLWNFGEIWEILPLCDPAAAREHIRAFLKADLLHHHSFNPLTGASQGSWYPVNQEKIVGLIHYYVLHTGDRAFLEEDLDGRTVLDHAVLHALYGDDPGRPLALLDYGPANDHLELRRCFRYHHVMPDLNGRRYATYLRAAALCDLAGRPRPGLRARAGELKRLLKEKLWDPQARWFPYQDDAGRKENRYTVQVLKLLGSGVLDAEEEEGLLAHLNEREFLSEYGLHSMSKLDPAYDQLDIDNGGGGICPSFPMQILEKLYLAGHDAPAADLLRRVLWWGNLLPYWGDSLVANAKDYRRDTPLQCMVDGAAGAQAIIFGVFGISVTAEGAVRVAPHALPFAPQMSLRGLKIRGLELDVAVDGSNFNVKSGKKEIASTLGQPVQLLGIGD